MDSKTGNIQNQRPIEQANSFIDSNENFKFKPAFDCRFTQENSIMSNQYERWYNVFESRKNKSLLAPQQFSMLVYGSCREKNELSNKCAQMAYKSSATEGENCLEKKNQCIKEMNLSRQQTPN